MSFCLSVLPTNVCDVSRPYGTIDMKSDVGTLRSLHYVYGDLVSKRTNRDNS